jgi:hypothetical protein
MGSSGKPEQRGRRRPRGPAFELGNVGGGRVYGKGETTIDTLFHRQETFVEIMG